MEEFIAIIEEAMDISGLGEVEAACGWWYAGHLWFYPVFKVIFKSGETHIYRAKYGYFTSDFCNYGGRLNYEYLSQFLSGWAGMLRPTGKADKSDNARLVKAEVKIKGVKVEWLSVLHVCAVCLSPIERRTPERPDYEYSRDRVNLPETKKRAWYYGIHPQCNPRKRECFNMFTPYNASSIYDDPEHGREVLSLMAKCWPGFAVLKRRIYLPVKGWRGKIAEKAHGMRRIIRKWAARNAGRTSTEGARTFFKLHFGIKQLTNYINGDTAKK